MGIRGANEELWQGALADAPRGKAPTYGGLSICVGVDADERAYSKARI